MIFCCFSARERAKSVLHHCTVTDTINTIIRILADTPDQPEPSHFLKEMLEHSHVIELQPVVLSSWTEMPLGILFMSWSLSKILLLWQPDWRTKECYLQSGHCIVASPLGKHTLISVLEDQGLSPHPGCGRPGSSSPQTAKSPAKQSGCMQNA